MSTSSTVLNKSKQLSKKDLHPEQNAAIDRLFEHDETLLIAGLGFGKAIVGLTSVAELLAEGHLKRVLVLAPLTVANLTWGAEPAKWSHIPNDLVAIATGTPQQRHAALATGARAVVTNFENIGWMLKHYGAEFDGLLIDECTKLKSVGGAGVKTLRHWVKKLKWRCGMSGTPVSQSGADIYAQALLLDLGKALGTRKQGFLQTYFYAEDWEQRKWLPKPGAEQLIADRLIRLVFRADDAGYLDALPPVHTEYRAIDLSDEGAAVYAEMAKHSVWESCVAENAAVQTSKLQQICAGGLYAGDKRELIWTSRVKRDYIRSHVGKWSMPQIIVYQFAFERDWLLVDYPEALVMGGGAKITAADLERWNRGEIKLLIMHMKSASHGLNLQYGCCELLHLSPCWSADGWKQTLGRIWRRGQTEPVRRKVLFVPNTIESEQISRMKERNEKEKIFIQALR